MTNLHVRPRQILRWAAVLTTLMLAAALCLSCLSLYHAGTSPENLTDAGVLIGDIYTRENVGRQLARIAPLAAVWAVLMIAAAFFPTDAPRPSRIDPENALRLIRPRIEATPAMLRQQRFRRILRVCAGAAIAACLAGIAAYMTDVSHFASWDLESVMAEMTRSLALPAAASVLILCACEILLGRSYTAEWAEAKQAPQRTVPAEKAAARRAFPTNAARILIAATAAGLILAGILNGGMYDVLVKAINICTECIGLG